jgi:hypothetical protein
VLAAPVFAVSPATDCYFPAFGHALGAADATTGTRPWWRGDVWIFNPSTTTPATVDIYLLLRNQANPSPESRRITVSAGETRYLPDIIYNTFGYDNLFAGIRVVSSIPVLATGRSYDANVNIVQKGQGTAGQFFGGLSSDIAIGNGQSSDVIGLDQDKTGTSGNFRSNLAIVETTGNSATFDLQRYDSNGTILGTLSGNNIDGRSVIQVNYVVTAIVPTPGSDQRVRLVVTGGSGKVIAVASRIDNISGDPSTVDMSTPSAAAHSTGRFEGIVLDTTGTRVDGGLQLIFGQSALTGLMGLAGLPCGTDSYTLDFSPSQTVNVTVNSDGTFSIPAFPIQYSDGTNTIFTTTWTVAGARNSDGTITGTVRSDTTGGSGSWASCNQTGITRSFRAGWTGTP